MLHFSDAMSKSTLPVMSVEIPCYAIRRSLVAITSFRKSIFIPFDYSEKSSVPFFDVLLSVL